MLCLFPNFKLAPLVIKQLSKVHDVTDDQPDFSPLGLAVSPASIRGRLKKRASNLTDDSRDCPDFGPRIFTMRLEDRMQVIENLRRYNGWERVQTVPVPPLKTGYFHQMDILPTA